MPSELEQGDSYQVLADVKSTITGKRYRLLKDFKDGRLKLVEENGSGDRACLWCE